MEDPVSENCEILVIDDDQSIRDLLKIILESGGFSVTTAPNGKAALNILESMKNPRLIFLDLMMPVMNGWEFYENISAHPRYQKIPVVVITAYPKKEVKIPAAEILIKPMEVSTLLEVGRKYCGHKKATA